MGTKATPEFRGWCALIGHTDETRWLWPFVVDTRRDLIQEYGHNDWQKDRRRGYVRAVRVRVTVIAG